MTNPTNLAELKEEIYSETQRIMQAATEPPSREDALLNVALRTCNRINPEKLTAMLQELEKGTTEFWS